MSRKIISVFLALILCFSLVISVSAADRGFIIDELGYLEENEVSDLNELASGIYDKTGVGIFYAYVHADSAENYDVSAIVGNITDHVVMVETEEFWFMHKAGLGEALTYDDEDAIRAIYDETETYAEGVAAYLKATAEYFPEVPAATEAAVPEDERFLYDDADLLTDEQESALTEKLEDISHACDAQIVIATMASMDGGDIDSFVDYLYDSMGFGYGEDHDGVLLLVCMDPREYRILSNGYAGVAIGPDQIDTLCDIVEFYLSDGNYSTAFNLFANECEEFLEYYLEGSPFKVGKNLMISLVIGIIAGLIVAFILKGQLKSVRKQDSARVYVKQDSLQITYARDIFLYRNVTCTKKQERVESSSSGSGSTARSKGGGSF